MVVPEAAADLQKQGARRASWHRSESAVDQRLSGFQREVDARRIVHLRLITRTGDHEELGAFLKQAIPFYESLRGVRVRLLRSVEHPDHFIEVIEYETIEAFESDEKRLSGDPQMQRFIKHWRKLLKGGVEVETYEDVTGII